MKLARGLRLGTYIAAVSLIALACGKSDKGGGGGDGDGDGDGDSGGSAGDGDGDTGGGSGDGDGDTGGTGTGGDAATGGMGAMGGMGGDPVQPPPSQFVIGADGITVRLFDVGAGELTEVDSASIPSAGLIDGHHQIFNMIQQPGQQRIFVASANDCSPGDVACWGNGRIDRFTYTATSITYDGAAYIMNDAAFQADGISCAEGTEEETEFAGQEGNCAPNGMVFSPDGSRLYVDDDDDDLIEIFSVDGDTNDLSFIAEGGSTDVHGLTIESTGQYLYNGIYVNDVTGDAVSNVASEEGGNSTALIPGTPLQLITGLGTHSVGLYDLTDLEAPVEVDLLEYEDNIVRSVSYSSDFSFMLSTGQNNVKTISLTEGVLEQEDEVLYSGFTGRQNRSVALSKLEDLAVVAFFRGGNGGDIVPGGYALYSVGENLELVEVDTLDVPAPGKGVLMVDVE